MYLPPYLLFLVTTQMFLLGSNSFNENLLLKFTFFFSFYFPFFAWEKGSNDSLCVIISFHHSYFPSIEFLCFIQERNNFFRSFFQFIIIIFWLYLIYFSTLHRAVGLVIWIVSELPRELVKITEIGIQK